MLSSPQTMNKAAFFGAATDHVLAPIATRLTAKNRI
jgi:hypothetical protein